MRQWWILLAFLAAFPARADQINIGFGPSMDGGTNPKFGTVQYEHDWGSFALIGSVTAIFEDPILWTGSLIPSAKVVTPGGVFVRVGLGIGFVSRTDDRLSSIPQFNPEMALGLSNDRFEVGGKGDHWSNGSVLGGGPNLGRDTLQLYLGVKF